MHHALPPPPGPRFWLPAIALHLVLLALPLQRITTPPQPLAPLEVSVATPYQSAIKPTRPTPAVSTERPPSRPTAHPILSQRTDTPLPTHRVSDTAAAPTATSTPANVSAPTAHPPGNAPLATPTLHPPRHDAAYLNNPQPAYPALSRRMGEQGKVLLRVLVSPDGHPRRVEIAEGSRHPRLDDAALRAVQQWRFIPARLGNEPVEASVLVPLVFRLEE